MSAPRFADIRAPCQAALRATLFDRAARPARHPLRAGEGVRAGRPFWNDRRAPIKPANAKTL